MCGFYAIRTKEELLAEANDSFEAYARETAVALPNATLVKLESERQR